MPQTELIIFGVLAVTMALFSFMSVIVVQETEALVIERLGVYNRTLKAGIHFVVPFVDRIAKKISLSEQVHTTSKNTFNTLDDETQELQVSLYYLVKDSKLYAYGLKDLNSLSQLILDKTRYEVLKTNKQDIKLDLKSIELLILNELEEVLGSYGIKGTRVSIDL